MKIPMSVICVLLAASLAVEGYTLKTISEMQAGLAALTQEVRDISR